MELFGLLTGHTDGQVTVSASLAGQSGTAPVSVHLVDILQLASSLGNETFIPGGTMLMQLGGFYGVASADSGQLSMLITDQNNAVISTVSRTVARGGDQFVMGGTFTIPLGTSQVCRKMVLEIGTTTLTAIPDAGLRACFTR